MLLIDLLLKAYLSNSEVKSFKLLKYAREDDSCYGVCFKADGCKQYLRYIAKALKSYLGTETIFENEDCIELLATLISPFPAKRGSAEELLRSSKWLAAEEL